MNDKKESRLPQENDAGSADKGESVSSQQKAVEIGGYKGPEPTRYGDWEQKGRCTDF